MLLACYACNVAAPSVDSTASATNFLTMGTEVEVAFHGEIANLQLFGDDSDFPVRPLDVNGLPEGRGYEISAWLEFSYRIGQVSQHVLVAKRPIMNFVSWNALARAGAALDDGAVVTLDGESYVQDASVRDRWGRQFRVRLPKCGYATMATLSEWNLLIGGIHEGDLDFAGERYGWVNRPYTDQELKVGHGGTLSWCQEAWGDGGERVTRGYFHVSRFHATPSDFRGERVYWRPVLEYRDGARPIGTRAAGERSPNGAVWYYGRIANDALFGPAGRLTDQLPVAAGRMLGDGRPQWLHFEHRGMTVFIAARPLRYGLSWNNIAEAGAARGDTSRVWIDGRSYRQDATISDIAGNRYLVRLLQCGGATMDVRSEWNALLGAIHEGDGDFLRSRDGAYGWIAEPLSDVELHVGDRSGAATWCQESRMIEGSRYVVNRGYFTVSRFHLTEGAFAGAGFGWRPVLVRLSSVTGG